MFKQRWWRYTLIICMFIGTFTQYQHRAPRRQYSDFHYPYMTGKLLLAGEKIYSFDTGFSYFKYPPFYANLMTPLSVMPERIAASFWYILNFLFFMILFSTSRRIFAENKDEESFWLYSITYLVMVRFMTQNLHEGQANVFMLTLLTAGLYYYLHHKSTKSAFFIAFSVMTKYMPVFFLPYFLLLGNFKLLFLIGIFIILFNFFPVLSFGWHKTLVLLKEQFDFLFVSSLDPWSVYCSPNQSLLGALSRFFWDKSEYHVHIMRLDRPVVWTMFFIIAGILYTLAVWPSYSKKLGDVSTPKARWGISLDWALISICMALCNPNAWKNFFICLLFPYMLVIYHLLKVKFKDWSIFTLFMVSFALNSWTSEMTAEWFAGESFEVLSCITFGSLALFAAVFILKIRHLREQRADPGIQKTR